MTDRGLDREFERLVSQATPLDPSGPALERDDIANLAVPIGTQCVCGQTNVTGVPFLDVAIGATGYVWACLGCGAQWAVGVELKRTMILVGKPTSRPEASTDAPGT